MIETLSIKYNANENDAERAYPGKHTKSALARINLKSRT